ncbi:ABC transporter substrate-binding protein [Cellulosimicrobium funkei]|nr:ABC transporter substrate-binding protein [Cellulosimicrobium funkei]
MSLSLTLACQAYDRVQPILAGDVQIKGVDLTFLDLPVEETFFRMLTNHEFDVAEMSLSSYVLTLGRDAPFVAVPVFPSRAFRHSGIYVRSDSPWESPQELRGARIGVPEYQITAAVWIRGIMQEFYDLPIDSASYYTGGVDQPGRTEKVAIEAPEGVSITPIPPTATLSDMLVEGELDAVYSARNPGPFNRRTGQIRRLFRDPQGEEKSFFDRTGIFPIMHTLVVRRDVYERNPWVATELVKAFTRSKDITLEKAGETAALNYALPWAWAESEELRESFGPDWWPYGVANNESVLDKFLTYSHGQGLADRKYAPAELFAPETLEQVKV